MAFISDWFDLVPSINSSTHIKTQVTVNCNAVHLNFFISELPNLTSRSAPITHTRTGNRKDYLWQDQCFEFFLKLKDSTYLEFNLSLNGDWNVYHFNSYRNPALMPPRWASKWELQSFKLTHPENSTIQIEAIFFLSSPVEDSLLIDCGQCLMNLTAITFNSQQTVYWAIQHALPHPDFHDHRYWTDHHSV